MNVIDIRLVGSAHPTADLIGVSVISARGYCSLFSVTFILFFIGIVAVHNGPRGASHVLLPRLRSVKPGDISFAVPSFSLLVSGLLPSSLWWPWRSLPPCQPQTGMSSPTGVRAAGQPWESTPRYHWMARGELFRIAAPGSPQTE